MLHHPGVVQLLGMLQSRFFVLDGLFPLPTVGLKDFVEDEALHTSLKHALPIVADPIGSKSAAEAPEVVAKGCNNQ